MDFIGFISKWWWWVPHILVNKTYVLSVYGAYIRVLHEYVLNMYKVFLLSSICVFFQVFVFVFELISHYPYANIFFVYSTNASKSDIFAFIIVIADDWWNTFF